MHGCWLIGVSILAILAMLAYVIWLVHCVRRHLWGLQHVEGIESCPEAKVAHRRLDRIDAEMKGDRSEFGILNRTVESIKRRVSFIMHKDISEELARQREDEARRDGEG